MYFSKLTARKHVLLRATNLGKKKGMRYSKTVLELPFLAKKSD
jgi:hypothetical protein